MTDLEGRSLDEALARAMGGEAGSGLQQCVEPSRWERRSNPPWHDDLTYLLRDIEPVCRERGMVDWTVGTYIGGGYAARVTCSDFSGNAYGPTAATALARAFYAVLTRGES